MMFRKQIICFRPPWRFGATCKWRWFNFNIFKSADASHQRALLFFIQSVSLTSPCLCLYTPTTANGGSDCRGSDRHVRHCPLTVWSTRTILFLSRTLLALMTFSLQALLIRETLGVWKTPSYYTNRFPLMRVTRKSTRSGNFRMHNFSMGNSQALSESLYPPVKTFVFCKK